MTVKCPRSIFLPLYLGELHVSKAGIDCRAHDADGDEFGICPIHGERCSVSGWIQRLVPGEYDYCHQGQRELCPNRRIASHLLEDGGLSDAQSKWPLSVSRWFRVRGRRPRLFREKTAPARKAA